MRQSSRSLRIGVLLGAVAAAASAQTTAIEGSLGIPSDVDPGHVVVYVEGDLGSGQAGRVRVVQSGVRFDPAFVALPAGWSIEFVNAEPREVTHNVFSRSPAWTADLGLFGPGNERASAFPTPGLVRVMCSIHRQMQMEVFVTPNRFFALPAGGRFRIEDLPPGDHVVRAWSGNNRLKPARAEVRVPAGATARLDLALESRGSR